MYVQYVCCVSIDVARMIPSNNSRIVLVYGEPYLKILRLVSFLKTDNTDYRLHRINLF